MEIETQCLTTCEVAADGGAISLGFVDSTGKPATIRLSLNQVGALVMTLPAPQATTFVLFITGPAFAALGKDLARHGLEFCHTDTPTGVLRPDGSHVVHKMDQAANIAALNALAAGDGDQYGRDVGEIGKNAGLLFGLLGGRLWSRPTLKLLAGEAWRRGTRGLAAFLGEALTPARGWLETAPFIWNSCCTRRSTRPAPTLGRWSIPTPRMRPPSAPQTPGSSSLITTRCCFARAWRTSTTRSLTTPCSRPSRLP